MFWLLICESQFRLCHFEESIPKVDIIFWNKILLFQYTIRMTRKRPILKGYQKSQMKNLFDCAKKRNVQSLYKFKLYSLENYLSPFIKVLSFEIFESDFFGYSTTPDFHLFDIFDCVSHNSVTQHPRMVFDSLQ